MSNLIVVTFDNPNEAGQVRQELRQLDRRGVISLDDAAVVVKEADGKLRIKNEPDRGLVIGAVGGGLLGLLLVAMFPLAGIAIGAAGGALAGKLMDMGVDQKFVKEVAADLQPGNSALFVLVRDAEPAAALGALRPYKGTVHHTSLPPDTEAELRRVLAARTE